MRVCTRIEMATKNDLYEVITGDLLGYKEDAYGGYNVFLGDEDIEWCATKKEVRQAMRDHMLSSIYDTATLSSFSHTRVHQLPEKVRGICARAK